MALLHFYKPEDFGAANFVMDFQMDILDMNNPNILIKKGPNLDKLDKHDKNYIASTLMELWSETNHTNTLCFEPHTIKKCLCFGCCIYFILLVCMIAVLESNIPLFPSNKMKQIVAISLGFISIVVLAIILFGMLLVMQRRSAAREKWRARFVNILCSYLIELKQQYSNLTFSIIYPMCIYSQRIKTHAIHSTSYHEKVKLYRDSTVQHELLRGDEYISAIWCYLRVSEGSIVTSDTEPIYQSTQHHIRRDSKDSEYSKVTSVTSAYSLQIEDDDRMSNIIIEPPSKKGSVQTGKFPIRSKNGKFKYKTLL
eukprot:323280_1